jgi:hypothetical protein
MTFSTSEINELEYLYGVFLPEQYRTILLLIGDKIMDISIRSPSNKNISGDILSSSIYEIQDNMRISVADYGISELCHPSVFFITTFLRYDDCKYVAYFIKAERANNHPVYCWRDDTVLDISSIEKFSDNIEQWLYKINPILYIELQARKIFFR